MMQVFYFDVAYVYNGFKCFSGVLQVFQKHVSFVFRRMLQLLHLDVSKLDRVLHIPPRLSAISPRCQTREGGGGPQWRGRALRACGRAQHARRGQAGAGREKGAVARASGQRASV